MSVAMPIIDSTFAARLDLALKALSIGRSRLAQEIGVDKSLVSRWLSGAMRPAEHNLERITRLLAVHCPGFTMLDWEGDGSALARRLGIDTPQAAEPVSPRAPAPGETVVPPPRAAQPSDVPHARAQSLIEVEREGVAYPGVYVLFRVAFRNTGELLAELIVIWRDGNRLFFRSFDPSFSHTGEMLIVRHQLFALGEDDARADGLMYWIVNGVSGQKLFRTDGIAMSVAGDRYRTPGAALIVLQRIADLPDSGQSPSNEVLSAIATNMKAAYLEGRVDGIAGARVVEAIRPRVGSPRRDGSIDYLLRQPMERSLATSEVELSPEIAAELIGARDAFVGGAGAPALSLGPVFAVPRLALVG